MKRNLLLSVIFFLSINIFTSLWSQDIIIMRDGSEMNAVVTEIGTNEVKYKKFDNRNGPTYSVSKNDIFLIKYQNGEKDIFEETDAKQEAKNEKDSYQQPEYLNIREGFWTGTRVLDKNGYELNKQQIRTILAYDNTALNTYNSGLNMKTVGNIFYIAEVSCFVIGILDYALWSDGDYYNSSYWGWYVGGVICMVPAIIFDLIGDSRIKSSVNIYNNALRSGYRSDVSVNFGFTQSGIGFSIKF